MQEGVCVYGCQKKHAVRSLLTLYHYFLQVSKFVSEKLNADAVMCVVQFASGVLGKLQCALL